MIQQGLVAAIKQEVSWLIRCGFRNVEFEENGYSLETADSEKDLFIYRLVQEALNNIIKHAEADTVSIRISFEKQNMLLTIGDNGKGFDITDEQNNGMGLANMRKRLVLLNGNMQIESATNKGTNISFSIPYPRI